MHEHTNTNTHTIDLYMYPELLYYILVITQGVQSHIGHPFLVLPFRRIHWA